jgi:hypothetical protein
MEWQGFKFKSEVDKTKNNQAARINIIERVNLKFHRPQQS